MLLGHRVTHTVSAAADDDLQRTAGANAWLRWSVFEHLAAEGYAANDLTDASIVSVARFKSQLGGDLVQSVNCERPHSFTYAAQRRAQRALGLARRVGRRGG